MSSYYNIEGIGKVRVSDHEPNYSMDKFRGENNLCLYTKDACGSRLSIEAQIERYCEKTGADISLFSQVLSDFPEPTYVYIPRQKIEVTQEIADAYHAICGKGAMRKKERFCEAHNINEYKMSQGHYIIVK